MASIGSIDFKLRLDKDRAHIDVTYPVTFEQNDVGRRYLELCRIIGDDTDVGDPPEAGDDDPLAYLAPLFFRRLEVGQARTVQRKLKVTVPTNLLDEDYGPIPGPDELRALVVLTPIAEHPTWKESNLVRKT